MDTCCEIRPYMWLGGCNAPIPSHVTHGLGVGEDASSRRDFEKYTLLEDIEDSLSQDLASYFERAFKAIDDARCNNRVIYVHCTYGHSRSPAIVVAYLMKRESLSFEDVYREIDNLRHIGDSFNPYFREQLLSIE